MLNWGNLTSEQKAARVHELNTIRQKMQLEARTKRAAKPKKQRVRTSFKSKELEELFNSLPPEMQKLVS